LSGQLELIRFLPNIPTAREISFPTGRYLLLNGFAPIILVSDEDFGLYLRCAEARTELGWSHACEPLEDFGEVALVEEARSYGYLDKRRVRTGNRMAGVFDSQPPDVLTYSASIMLTEHAGQMSGMHADGVRYKVVR
jgi:hypothetical protein